MCPSRCLPALESSLGIIPTYVPICLPRWNRSVVPISLAVVQLPFTVLTGLFHPKCNLLKARVIIHAYNHHVRLLPPEPFGRQATRVYSGRGSRHCYAIKSSFSAALVRRQIGSLP